MKLIALSGKLLVIAGTRRYCMPMAYSYENNLVVIRSIDDSTIEFKAPLTEVLDSTDTPFAGIDALETFLIPLLGFNTAPGGSGALETLEVVSTETGAVAVASVQTGAGMAFEIYGNGNTYVRGQLHAPTAFIDTLASPFFPGTTIGFGSEIVTMSKGMRPGYVTSTYIMSLSAATYAGMIVFAHDTGTHYASNGTTWTQIQTA